MESIRLGLSSPVTDVPRIGPAKAKYLAKLGITHARDFLYTFPRRYDDFSTITPIAELIPGKRLTVQGHVKKVKSNWGFRGRQRLLRIFVDIEDDSGILSVTWYNLRFLQKQLWIGREIYVAGTAEEKSSTQRGKANSGERHTQSAALLTTNYLATSRSARSSEATTNPAQRDNLLPRHRMRSPVLEFADTNSERVHTGRITPVYPETKGVTSRFLRYNVKQLLSLIELVPEYLPEDIRTRNALMGIHEAVRTIHFPSSTAELEQAQRRLRFDELFFLQLAARVRQRSRQQQSAHPIKPARAAIDAFISSLPFVLTQAQQEALADVLRDLARGTPMNRLLQGDVGSGKSVIAMAAAHAVLQAGFSVLYVAPTEILARQQAESFTTQLGQARVSLLVGSMRQSEKAAIKDRLRKAEPLCVVGTHALFQQDVSAANCALVIIDEQHRFGVEQRKALQAVGTTEHVPHFLSMTATPIPRTLNLTVFGDLEVSTIKELPAGRRPVKTAIVGPTQRDDAIVHILRELHAGRQAYVIAPLIEDSLRLEVRSATSTADEMQKLFPDVAVGLMHGQLPPEEKEAALRNFAAGAIQLLVSTSVVEVGMNVPNASIIIIEGAERFGLAQLHQFRGRVGRGEHQSYCYLFPTSAEGFASPRLQALVATNDGFAIAEQDLRLRGPGEMYGVSQSGFGNLQVASLLDYEMIKLTRAEADIVLADNPDLSEHPILQKKVEQKNKAIHLE